MVPASVGLCLLCLLTLPDTSSAQLSFASAINLALKNSPRIHSAELELRKAQENLKVAKDIFIPSVVLGGGLGWTYGITLTVPTIFTVNAQSLIYSNQQRFTIRAAHADLEAAQFSLLEARQRTEEDTAIAFVSLQNNQAAFAALSQQHELATRLVAILEDRVRAGLDSPLDLNKARRGSLQIELQQLLAQDEQASLLSQLGDLTGLAPNRIALVSDPTPAIPNAQILAASTAEEAFLSPEVLAAKAATRSKLDRARGDAGYTWRPIITFNAQYGRISPINDVSSFYNLHGNYNTVSVGAQFAFPILDKVRSAAARESLAEAARASIDEANKHTEELQGELKLERSVRVIATRAQIAELDFAIAQDELKSTLIQLHATEGTPPLTPKEEQQAHMQERQKYLDLLNARLQLEKAKISLLRQTGQLDQWVRSLQSSPPTP